jgi:heme-degrading monooxygenase HmoA
MSLETYPDGKEKTLCDQVKKEEIMQTKVIIKRHVTHGKEKEFFELLKKLRRNAMNQNGYISGETLLNADDTSRVMVISKWETLDSWKHWMESDTRKELDSDLTKCQETPAEYEHYVFRKFRAAADQGFPAPMQGNKIL